VLAEPSVRDHPRRRLITDCSMWKLQSSCDLLGAQQLVCVERRLLGQFA
jgi:hypothetical protein